MLPASEGVQEQIHRFQWGSSSVGSFRSPLYPPRHPLGGPASEPSIHAEDSQPCLSLLTPSSRNGRLVAPRGILHGTDSLQQGFQPASATCAPRHSGENPGGWLRLPSPPTQSHATRVTCLHVVVPSCLPPRAVLTKYHRLGPENIQTCSLTVLFFCRATPPLKPQGGTICLFWASISTMVSLCICLNSLSFSLLSQSQILYGLNPGTPSAFL